MDPAIFHREPDVENLRTDFIGCPSLLTRHAKKKKNEQYETEELGGDPNNIYSYNKRQKTFTIPKHVGYTIYEVFKLFVNKT